MEGCVLSITREDAREAVVLLREEFEAQLQTNLTPEQYEQLLGLGPDRPRIG